jgi:hypothetical protein
MTTHAQFVMARLEVPRDEFLEALKGLRPALRARRPGEAIVRMDEESLLVRVGGCEVFMSAAGRWPGEARVSAALFAMLAKAPPSGDPLAVWVESGRFFVGNISMACQWQKDGSAQIEVPLGATLKDLLRLRHQHTDQALEQAGLLGRVQAAQQEAAQRISKAAVALAPLGIGAADIQALVARILGPQAPSEAPER